MPASVDPRFFIFVMPTIHHDRVFAENVTEYLDSVGIKSKSIAFGVSGQRPELRECLQAQCHGRARIQLAARPFLARSGEFPKRRRCKRQCSCHSMDARPSKLSFAVASTIPRRRTRVSCSVRPMRSVYFRRYGIPGALTATSPASGPSRHSRVDELSFQSFAQAADQLHDRDESAAHRRHDRRRARADGGAGVAAGAGRGDGGGPMPCPTSFNRWRHISSARLRRSAALIS